MNLHCTSMGPHDVLLGTFASILSHTESRALWAELPQHLAPLIDFDFLNLILCDQSCRAFESHMLKPSGPVAENKINGLEILHDGAEVDFGPIHDCAVQHSSRSPFFPYLSDLLTQYDVQSHCSAPLVSGTKDLIGILTVGSHTPSAYTNADGHLLSSIAFHLAFVYQRWLELDFAKKKQRLLEREHESLLAMRAVSDVILSVRDLQQMMSAVSDCIHQFTGAEYADLLLYDAVGECFRRAGYSQSCKGRIREHWVQQMDDSPALIAFRTKQTFTGGREILERDARRFTQVAEVASQGIEEFCCIPLISQDKVLGTLNIGSRQRACFTPSSLELLSDIAKPITVAVENVQAQDQIITMKERLLLDDSYLSEEIRTDCDFEGIIGESPTLTTVLEQVQVVADSDATVLVLGETGTGKELVARAIHKLSSRKHQPFIKLNCAALPGGLLESELFGHERGAFTGAIGTKIGLLELANNGTIFLDEVGDIAIELQPKLLRVLQEGEFTRIGGTKTIKVDVRLIAATNRNLLEMIEDRQYRSDLYYRLNVFPITIPPLRERKIDIPLLVKHFTNKFATRQKRTISSIPSDVMEALVNWSWPGNVRELENLIERAVILSKGPVLKVPVKDLQEYPSRTSMTPQRGADELSTEITAEAIIRTLREANGIVSGPRGAAARLGLKRTTLLWRMNKLGITRKQSLS